MKNQQQWQDFVAELRLAQCQIEANRQDVAVPSWYLLEGKRGMKMERPYDPASGELEAHENWESVYAVSSPVPDCAIWFINIDNPIFVRNHESIGSDIREMVGAADMLLEGDELRLTRCQLVRNVSYKDLSNLIASTAHVTAVVDSLYGSPSLQLNFL